MGTAIGDLVEKHPATLEDFSRKRIAIDAFNTLYQFLSTMRGADGSLLMDHRGNVTSHLNGLFSRGIAMLAKGIRPAFVFDGKPPELKAEERERRRAVKEQARVQYEEAKEREDTEAMARFAARTAVITPQIIDDSRKLLRLLGIPTVDAPSEGEAQAAFMQKRGDVDFIASQDYDSLLFGAEELVRYLAVSPRKKQANTLRYERLQPEIIRLREVLAKLEVTHEQLICLGMLVGTDFNRGGIKGLGPKKALKLVTEHKDPEAIFAAAKWDDAFCYPWKEVYRIFADIPATEDYALEWKDADKEGVMRFLCDERDFARERVERELGRLAEAAESKKQKGLSDFF